MIRSTKKHLILCLLSLVVNGCKSDPEPFLKVSGKLIIQTAGIWKVGFFPNNPAMAADTTLAPENDEYTPLAVAGDVSKEYTALKSVLVAADGSYNLRILSLNTSGIGYLVAWRAKKDDDESFTLAGADSTIAYFAVRNTGGARYIIDRYEISGGLLYYRGKPVSGNTVGTDQYFSAFQKDTTGFDFYDKWPLPAL